MSDMSYDLKKMADLEKQEVIAAAAEATVDPDGFVPLGAPLGVESLSGVGAPMIILPGDTPANVPSNPAANAEVNTSTPNMPQLISASELMGSGSSEITEDDLRNVMPDLDDAAFMAVAKDMKMSLSKYQKGLVVNNGFTPEEALMAAKNKMKREGQEENDKWLESNPKTGIVTIDKKNATVVNFTPEEKEKLTRVKNIQLVVCEDAEIKSIPIKKVSKEVKSEILKMADFNLSKYSVPLPIYGDFVSVKGAQILQLAAAVNYEDSTKEEVIGREAFLLYEHLIGGQVMVKYGTKDGRKVTDMSYADFIKEFPYHDLEMGMFGILCASSSEEAVTHLTCNACKSPFEWTYNVKGLLNMEASPDEWKEIIDKVLANKTNTDILEEIHVSNMKVIRYKSPFSNHIYDISQPSIANAINMFSKITNQKDESLMSMAEISLFVRSMFIYSPEDESYIPINNDPTDDETGLLLEQMQIIPQKDLVMISRLIEKMVYAPRFILKSKCPNCGTKMQNLLDLGDMIFLAAQDSFTEMPL